MRVFQRGKNWYVDFRFKGQRIRECIGPSRKTAEAVIAKRKAEIAENKYLDVRKELKPLEFHAFAVEYIAWAKANKKPTSYREDITKMRRLDREFCGQDIRQITTDQIEKWKTKRKGTLKIKGRGNGEATVGPACVNGELRLLKHLFSKAVEWDRVKENPARKVKVLKGETQRVRFLSPEEAQRLLSNCEDPLRAIVIVVLHAGHEEIGSIRSQMDSGEFQTGHHHPDGHEELRAQGHPHEQGRQGGAHGCSEKRGVCFLG
jgi:hypothetical protein